MARYRSRRRFVRRIAAVSSVGLLAGCGGPGDGSSGDGDSGESGGSEQTTSAGSEVSEYLSDTENFDGNLTVKTSSDAVTVQVGVEGNNGTNAYDPPAIKITTGTAVTWEWTDNGGTHNVVSEGDGPLDSGSAVAEAGTTYEHSFEDSGTYLYYCVPHKSLGMKGAVVVE